MTIQEVFVRFVYFPRPLHDDFNMCCPLWINHVKSPQGINLAMRMRITDVVCRLRSYIPPSNTQAMRMRIIEFVCLHTWELRSLKKHPNGTHAHHRGYLFAYLGATIY